MSNVLRTNIKRCDGCAWSPDGSLIAIATADEDSCAETAPETNDNRPYITILCSQTGKEISRLKDFWYGKACIIAWSPDGKHIASHSRVWNVATGSFESLNFMNEERGVSWSPDGLRLSVCNDGANVACLQRACDLTEAGYVKGPVIFLERALWSPDSSRMILASNSGVCLNSVVLDEYQVVHWFHDYHEDDEEDSLQAVSWTPDGNGLLTYCSKAGRITTRKSSTGEIQSTIVIPPWNSRYSDVNSSAQFSPDGLKLAFIEFDDMERMIVQVVDVETGKCLAHFEETSKASVSKAKKAFNDDCASEEDDEKPGPFWFLEWSPDSLRLAFFAQQNFCIWNVFA